MTPVAKPSLILILLAALVVAGCTEPGTEPGTGSNGGTDGAATPPPQMTNAEARATLTDAVARMPDVFGIEMKIVSGGKELLTMKGTFDNKTGRNYLDIRGDADTLANFTPGEEGSDVLKDGFSFYSTPAGAVYLINSTAYVFAPHNDTQDEGGFGGFGSGAAEGGPLAGFLDPEDTLANLASSQVNVTSVKPLVYRGKPAIEVTVADAHDANATSKFTVFTESKRLARFETTLPADEEGGNPLAGAVFQGDFSYDNEVTVRAPQSVTRAVGLSYQSDRANYFSDASSVTWTFLQSDGIALSEIEAQVKGEEGQTSGDLSTLPTTFSMRLSEGAKSQDGVTLTFTDADGDGKVSKGDTLRIEAGEDGSLPTVVLYDTVTKTHVVPGVGLLATLALAALAGLVLRRR